MPTIVIQDVVVEKVVNGKKRYEFANVTYTDNGKNHTKKIMSFANPAVFDVVKSAKGGESYDIKLTKNDGGYWEWAAITPAGAEAPAASGSAKGGKVTGSNYETAEERAKRQLMIVRQSSISNALTYLTAVKKDDFNQADVLALAQDLVDFVYGTDEVLEDDDDIPY